MMGENTEINKACMSDAGRLALCQKLDQELDDFINSLEKKRYTEGWPEDRWEEEMDKHPFFMKSTPADGEMSPLAEGLAKLKYDPEENTPLELATSYKEDGNFNFKHKNYRLAILGYTEGIKVRSDDATINASLYNNRAASHWHLKNYRSALFDSEKALSFDPNHSKARLRAAKAALELMKFDLCIEHCEKILENHSKDKEIIELLNAAKKKKLVQERDERKKNKLNEKRNEQKEVVVKAIIERGIKIAQCDDKDSLDLAMLEHITPGAEVNIVHLVGDVLIWPVLLLYPEYETTDFIKSCPENVPLINHLEQIFPASWDKKNQYSPLKINLFFEGSDKMPHLVNTKKTLGDILRMKYFVLQTGTPSFFVLPRGSLMERNYLESYI